MEKNTREIKEPDVEAENEGDSFPIIATPFNPGEIRLMMPPTNLGDLIEMIEADWINFATHFQRSEDLWTNRQKSRLIESVLLGLRLPAFYFEEVTKRKWDIIDGLQRCCAIRDFCVKKTLRLEGLEFLGDKFEGKTYDELPFEVKHDFRMSSLTVNVLMAGTPFEVRYILFSRLNTGGVPLTPQEVRTAMFYEVAQHEKEMAEDVAFQTATLNKLSSRRQEDLDFVSRFIAFYLQNYENYQPDLERFIKEGLKIVRDKLSPEQISTMKSDFTSAMRAASEIFGDDAFRKRYEEGARRRPLNKAYFEVIASSLAKMDEHKRTVLIRKKELLKRNLLILMNEDRFWNSFSMGTGTRDSVLQRFGGFKAAVEATILDRTIQVKGE